MPPPLPRRLRGSGLLAGLRSYLAFFGLAVLLHWPLFFGAAADRMRIGSAAGDYQRQFHPYRAFVARAWSGFQPPLWNPHQLAGSPALADPQLAVLYPLRLPQAMLAWVWDPLPLPALDLELLLHLALGAWGTALLLGRLGARPPARAFGGLAFGLGGYLTGYPLQQLAILDTAVWFPLIFWALIDWLRADAGLRQLRPLLLLSLMPILAGHPQTALFGFYGALAWALALGLRAGLPAPLFAGRVGAWLLATAGLGALQWLPAADFLRRSARQLSEAEIAAGLPLADSLQLLAPGVLSHWSPLYLGLPSLALALLAWRRAPWAGFFIGLAGAAWLLSLGGNQPLFDVLRLLPGLDWFRHQERAAFLWSFGLAVAAGLGLDRLLGSDAQSPVLARLTERRLLRWGTVLAAAALLLLVLKPQAGSLPVADACAAEATAAAAPLRAPNALVAEEGSARRGSGGWRSSLVRSSATPDGLGWGRLSSGLAQALAFSALMALLAGAILRRGRGPAGLSVGAAWALVGLLAFDLASVNRGRALCPAQADPGRDDPLLAALLPHARDGRVSSEALLPGGPNAASLWGLQDSTGDSPLRLAGLEQLVKETPELVWWRVLGVRYLVTARPPDRSPLQELARRGGADGAALYEVQLPAAPVWLPVEVHCPAAGPASAADADRSDGSPAAALPPRPPAAASAPWQDPAYDPIRRLDFPAADPAALAACRRAGAPPVGSAASAAVNAGAAAGSASLTGLNPGRAAMSASLPAAGWLVWSQAYDPGWRVTARAVADGRVLSLRPAPAWGAVMAVPLPAGDWSLRWTYWPEAVNWGGLLSLATAVLIFRPRRRRKSPALPPPQAPVQPGLDPEPETP